MSSLGPVSSAVLLNAGTSLNASLSATRAGGRSTGAQATSSGGVFANLQSTEIQVAVSRSSLTASQSSNLKSERDLRASVQASAFEFEASQSTTQGNTVQSMLARESEVSANIRISAGQMLGQALGQTMPTATTTGDSGRDDLISRLNQISPELGNNFQAFLSFLEQQNPKLAKSFEKLASVMANSLDAAGGAGGAAVPMVNGTPQTASVTRAQSVSVAVEMTVSQLKVQQKSGVEITGEQISVSFQANLRQVMGQSDPLILDLNENGFFDTTTAEEGNEFDILANGTPVRAATASKGDAFLVYDRNGNGTIDDGSELFGDQNGAADGFAELAKYDTNGDGVIDQSDEIYSKLKLWEDRDQNGTSEASELSTLADHGISAIQLNSQAADEDSNGNKVIKTGYFVKDDGSTGRVGDLLLNYLA